MFFRSKFRKKAHIDWCPYIQRIKEENKIVYSITDEVIDDGCVFCQHCSPMNKALKNMINK